MKLPRRALFGLCVYQSALYTYICTVYSADSFTDFEAQDFKFAPAWGWGILLTQTCFFLLYLTIQSSIWLTIKGEKEFNLAIHRLQLSLHYTLLEEQLQCIRYDWRHACWRMIRSAYASTYGSLMFCCTIITITHTNLYWLLQLHSVWLCIGCPLGCSTVCFYTGNRIDASGVRNERSHDPYIPVHIERIIIMTVQYDLDIYTQSHARLHAVSASYKPVSTLAKNLLNRLDCSQQIIFSSLHHLQYVLGEDWVAQLPDLPSLTMWYLKFHSQDTTEAYTIAKQTQVTSFNKTKMSPKAVIRHWEEVAQADATLTKLITFKASIQPQPTK